MNAIVNTGPGTLRLLDCPEPSPGRGEVRIRTAACGICATDLEMIAGWERTAFPAIPGHEWSGTVDAVGEDVDVRLMGTRCVAENVLPDGGEVGFEHPGGYAECFLTRAANIHRLPESFPLAHAVLIEPLAVCVRGLRRLRASGADTALVMGDGPIGLLMVALLRQRGIQRVALVGGRESRLRPALGLGAGAVVNYRTLGADAVRVLRDMLGGTVSHVIEASGDPSALSLAMDAVEPQGRLLVLGDYRGARAGFPWNMLLHRELELIGSNASAKAWAEAVALAVAESVPLGRLITHEFRAERFEEALALVRDRAGGAVKVVLRWDGLGR